MRIRKCLVLSSCLLLLLSLARLGGGALANMGWLELIKAMGSHKASNSHAIEAQNHFVFTNTLRSLPNQLESANGLLIANTVISSRVPDRHQAVVLARTTRGQLTLIVIVESLYKRVVELRETGQEYEAAVLWAQLASMNLDLPPNTLQGRKDHIDKLVRYKRNFKSAIEQYEIAILLRQPSPQDLVNLIALNQKAGYLADASHWEDEVRLRFPEARYLDNIYSNPYALDSLAYAYSQYGFLDDAIEVEQKALDLNPDFPWGNRQMAAFLIAHGEYERAEIHLQRAVAHSENSSTRIQWYLSDLGDLYREWGKPILAERVYCQMLMEANQLGVSPDRQESRPVRGKIAELSQVNNSAIEQFCDALP
jgi:tetratricopeptide (TPR) repeat protein